LKKIYLILFIILCSATSYSQYSLRAGLGIAFKNIPSFYDYLSQNFSAPNEELKNFNSAVNFSFEIDKTFTDNLDLGAEIGYDLYSYNYNFNLGQYDVSVSNFMPSVLAYYVIRGGGYQFKFGGGVGLRFINIDEHLPSTPTSTSYSSTGYGVILRGLGNTQIGKNIYANITADLKYDSINDVSNGNKKLYNNGLNENVNFNSFSVGLMLGITYLF